VYIVKIGSMDFKGLLKTVGETGFIKQVWKWTFCWCLPSPQSFLYSYSVVFFM